MSTPSANLNDDRDMGPSPAVVHALARLCADMAPEPSSEHGIPADWRCVIERLAGMPVTERLAALADSLQSFPDVDPDGLVDAIIACDPRVPAPSVSASEPPPSPFPVSPIYRETTETGSSGLSLVSIGEFLDQRDIEIPWLVDRLIPEKAAAILGGPAGYGKSWALSDLAIECARGGLWLGRFQTSQGGVLYFDEECGHVLMRFRLHRLVAGKRLQARGLDIHFSVMQGVFLDDPKSLASIRREIALHKPKLVIFDSLKRVNSHDENSASEMSKLFAIVKSLVQEFGCTIIFADHQRKPGAMAGSQDMMLRGSTDKVAFVDTLLSLHKRDDNLIIEHSKSRYGLPVAPFVIQITDTGPGSTVVRCLGDAEVIRDAAKQDEAKAFLSIALGSEWTQRKDLVAQAHDVGVSQKALDATLKALESEGEIERENRKPESGRGGMSAHYRRRSRGEVLGDLNASRACAELKRSADLVDSEIGSGPDPTGGEDRLV